MKFEITFHGHRNVRSTHKKTIEITKEAELTTRGDCIIGVSADSACTDIPKEIKERLQDPDRKITFTVSAGDLKFTVTGRGHPGLTLTHKSDIVIRKSRFTCSRTAAVECDWASEDLPKEMIAALQDPKTTGVFTIEV